jgi:hypothetical protein
MVREKMIGAPLAGARGLDDFDVETLIGEEAFVTGDQERQVMNRVHHRRLDLFRSNGSAHVRLLNRFHRGDFLLLWRQCSRTKATVKQVLYSHRSLRPYAIALPFKGGWACATRLHTEKTRVSSSAERLLWDV